MAGSAGIAQLVEHDLAKVGVASSSLVSRSSFYEPRLAGVCFFVKNRKSTGRVAEWLCSGLQIRVRRFNSDPGLQLPIKPRLERGFFVPAFSYHGRDGPDGETGRRKGLKIPRPQGHVGSIPTPGTRKGEPMRYSAYIASLLLTALAAWRVLAGGGTGWGWVLAVAGLLALLGTVDLLQRRSTLRRNYPLLAHLRYGLEAIGPEIRQYFIERDTEKVPFSREQRALVYQRSKHVMDVVPFGTERNVYGVDYEWINHSLAPSFIESHDFRVRVGGEGTAQPYDASVFNISAMSFGSLSASAVRALNNGARKGGFYHDTGEGSISPYHREGGGDLVWEIGSGYFGCCEV